MHEYMYIIHTVKENSYFCKSCIILQKLYMCIFWCQLCIILENCFQRVSVRITGIRNEIKPPNSSPSKCSSAEQKKCDVSWISFVLCAPWKFWTQALELWEGEDTDLTQRTIIRLFGFQPDEVVETFMSLILNNHFRSFMGSRRAYFIFQERTSVYLRHAHRHILTLTYHVIVTQSVCPRCSTKT